MNRRNGRGNLPNCRTLSNGTIEVAVRTDIGPRIVRYGFVGGENILGDAPEAQVKTELGEWRAWGGHRLWAAPESIPRTYVPDNAPVELEAIGPTAVRLVGPPEEPTGLQKAITVSLAARGSRITIEHEIINHNLWAIDLAPWALTIMNGQGGGVVILPQEPFLTHDEALLPARPMAVWHYTDMGDPRIKFGRKFIRVSVDAAQAEPLKLGIGNRRGWAAYLRAGILFVKRFEYRDGAAYPDFGSNCETYTAGTFVEIESIGPMGRLEPGASARHVEQWELRRVRTPAATEDAVERMLGKSLCPKAAKDA